MHRKECKACDVQFVALRSDAVTCSPRCRKRYERICRQITAEMEKLEAKAAYERAAKAWANTPMEG